jgi:hypothetical protein
MPECIDLTPLAGNRYRLDYDPAYAAEYGERGRTADPWLLTIPCQHGHFYPHGGNRLGFATNRRAGIGKLIAPCPSSESSRTPATGLTCPLTPSTSRKSPGWPSPGGDGTCHRSTRRP